MKVKPKVKVVINEPNNRNRSRKQRAERQTERRERQKMTSRKLDDEIKRKQVEGKF